MNTNQYKNLELTKHTGSFFGNRTKYSSNIINLSVKSDIFTNALKLSHMLKKLSRLKDNMNSFTSLKFKFCI